jgi:chromate transporter
MQPDYRQLFRVFGRIGIYSFGGPAAQIALMHRELVDDNRWLSEKDFLGALSFCMLLPGPEAMQLAAYSGWRLCGVPGGLIAGLLFILPGAAVMFALATIYAIFGNVPLVDAAFLGVQATVVAIVLEALFKVSKRALKQVDHWIIAGLAFVAIFAFQLPFPLILAIAALWGFVTAKQAQAAESQSHIPSKTAKTIAIWLALWAVPFLILFAFDAQFLTDVALFFSKLAIVTFGGAYAVLAYMTQTVVSEFGWISTDQMMDGLGLAETTPGPLILVTQFVAFQAAYQQFGLGQAFIAGVITLWVTFVPCFLWIFAGAPFVGRLTANKRLAGALSAITACVVGVILNLSLWFAAHVVFQTIDTARFGPISVIAPDPSSIDLVAAAIGIIGAFMLFVFHEGLGRTLISGALLGLCAGLVF